MTRPRVGTGVAPCEELGQSLQIALTSDQRVRGHGERADGVGRWHARVELRILLEHAPLQPAEVSTRLQPEFLVQPPSQLDIEVERLGLAARTVERQHRKALHALPQRLVPCQRERVTEHLVVPAEL